MRRAIVLLPTLVLSPALASAAGVVGNGTPGSCTEAALNAELAGGGAVTLSCGGGPVTIPMTTTKTISAALATDVDGGGLVTLDGQDTTRLFSVDDQRQLALRNLTLRRGRAADVGVAVRSHYHERGTAALTVEDVRFKGSVCKQVGDDVGGGAIYVQGGVSTADGSTFLRNRGGNGGAMTTSPGRGGAPSTPSCTRARRRSSSSTRRSSRTGPPGATAGRSTTRTARSRSRARPSPRTPR